MKKKVEKLFRGGNHIAILKINAEVCLKCGGRLYPAEAVKKFEQIRAKLARQEFDEFSPLGQSFQVVS